MKKIAILSFLFSVLIFSCDTGTNDSGSSSGSDDDKIMVKYTVCGTVDSAALTYLLSDVDGIPETISLNAQPLPWEIEVELHPASNGTFSAIVTANVQNLSEEQSLTTAVEIKGRGEPSYSIYDTDTQSSEHMIFVSSGGTIY